MTNADKINLNDIFIGIQNKASEDMDGSEVEE